MTKPTNATTELAELRERLSGLLAVHTWGRLSAVWIRSPLGSPTDVAGAAASDAIRDARGVLHRHSVDEHRAAIERVERGFAELRQTFS